MNELGRNPSRIIPAIRDFFDRQDAPRCRVVGEPIWPGRSAREMVEATRHEALLNVAFADAAVTILCPYESSGLDPAVLDDAQRTHPHVIRDQCRSPSCHYEDPLTVWAAAKWSLPGPVPPVATVTIDADLGALRAFAAAGAREAGLSQAQVRGPARRTPAACPRLASGPRALDDQSALRSGRAAIRGVRHDDPPARGARSCGGGVRLGLRGRAHWS